MGVGTASPMWEVPKQESQNNTLSFQQDQLPFLNSLTSFSVPWEFQHQQTQFILWNICVQSVFHYAQSFKHSRWLSNLSRKPLWRLCICSLCWFCFRSWHFGIYITTTVFEYLSVSPPHFCPERRHVFIFF